MSDAQKQESQKTVISFIFGLLIGGLLVWAFVGGHSEAPSKVDDKQTDKTASSTSTSTPDIKIEAAASTKTPAKIEVGEGKVTIAEAKAGSEVKLGAVTYPITNGWIGIRDYNDGKLGWILGVTRFSSDLGITPDAIPLVTPMKSGREYAVVIFKEAGDPSFNPATDAQLDTVFTTFKAE
jgi:hypothetical protein